MYLVSLEGSLALRIDKDALMTAAVNSIASHPGARAVVDGNAGKTLAGDLAVLEHQPSLGNVNAIVFSAELTDRHINDPSQCRLKLDYVRRHRLHDDVAFFTLTNDLQRLVDYERLLIQPGLDEDAIAGLRNLKRLRNRSKAPRM